MAELAAHLVDGVPGGLPVRQWVLTLLHRLRYAVAEDRRLCGAVLAVVVRAVLGFERRRARRRGVRGGGGSMTAIQRFGSTLDMNVHFHPGGAGRVRRTGGRYAALRARALRPRGGAPAQGRAQGPG